MKILHIKTREVSEVIHRIEVPDDYELYDADHLDDWAHELGERDSKPVEVCDVQIDSIISAEVVVSN